MGLPKEMHARFDVIKASIWRSSRVSYSHVVFIDNFDSLADLIASYPVITKFTHFVLVPGPLDITMNSTLPRKPLLSTFTARLKAKIPRIIFATNPCRIKFCDQEIVIFREDLMSRTLRNLVAVKPGVSNEDLRLFVGRISIGIPTAAHANFHSSFKRLSIKVTSSLY